MRWDRHPVLSLLESQWKMRQQYDQKFPTDGKSLKNKHKRQKKGRNPKELDCDSLSYE